MRPKRIQFLLFWKRSIPHLTSPKIQIHLQSNGFLRHWHCDAMSFNRMKANVKIARRKRGEEIDRSNRMRTKNSRITTNQGVSSQRVYLHFSEQCMEKNVPSLVGCRDCDVCTAVNVVVRELKTLPEMHTYYQIARRRIFLATIFRFFVRASTANAHCTCIVNDTVICRIHSDLHHSLASRSGMTLVWQHDEQAKTVRSRAQL